jgi:hypothetical protein
MALVPCPVSAQSAGPPLPSPSPARLGAGSVSGAVVDRDGEFLPGAEVRLTVLGSGTVLTTTCDDEGHFHFNDVPAGKVKIQASAEDFQPVETTGIAVPGETLEVPVITLSTAAAQFSVNAMTQAELAKVEVKQEEHQRLLGILPNFGIAYDWHAPPLTPRQKFELATRATIDPTTFGANAAIVGTERLLGGYPEFGPGAAGFWHLYGVSLADVAIGNELGGAILPTIFHQDPRYFWKGSGTFVSRLGYALSRAVICRGDNGKNQFSYSGVFGDLGAGALSNIYYPSQDRHGALLTFENGLLDIGSDAVGNVVQEFIFKWITPGSRKIPSSAPDSTK